MRKLRNEELNRLTVDQFKAAKKIPVTVVLDNVRSQHNIGSVFRTVDAFRLERILWCGITATAPHREIHKTALGATESVSWEYHESTLEAIRELRRDHYQIISVEQTEDAITLQQLIMTRENAYALVFGHEIKGVDQTIVDMSDSCLEIPQYGTKHSLNIAVAAGIVIWEVFKQFSIWLFRILPH